MRSRSGANRMEQRAPSRIAAPIAGFPYRSAVYCRMGGYVAAIMAGPLTARQVIYRKFPTSRIKSDFLHTTACALIQCTRSEEHTSELQSLMRISYAVFCLKK